MSNRLAVKIKKLMSFEGAIVPNVTGFNEDGTVNLDGIEPYLDYLHSIGVKGLYAHGTTGEGFSLSSEERMILSEQYNKIIKSKYPEMLRIFNVSATCANETMNEARFCDRLDVDAIAILPPIYYRPVNVDHLVQYLKAISLSAPELPMIYYHFPEMSNVDFDLAEFTAKAIQSIPTFAGMKYTCRDMVNMSLIPSRTRSSIKIFAAYEPSILPMISFGARAGVCALFNLAEPVQILNKMLKQFPNNMDEVTKSQDRMNEIFDSLRKGIFIENIKKRIYEETKGLINPGKPRLPIYHV